MKRIFYLMSLLVSFTAMAQEYTPLVREGVKWECVLEVFDPQMNGTLYKIYYPYTIQFEGDTIINDISYKKCFYRFKHKDIATSHIPRAFMREDVAEQKVYCICNPKFEYSVERPRVSAVDETGKREMLLYDFANPLNDSIDWCSYYTSLESSKLQIGGKELKTHKIHSLHIIESIGFSGQDTGFNTYCSFYGDLISVSVDYMPCLCQMSYPIFHRFVDENDNTIFSVSRFEADENYTPLVREGIKWNCVMHKIYNYPTKPEEQDTHSLYSIKFKGDTIINNIQYKKCYYEFDDPNEPSNVIPRAFLREDAYNKKVYVIYNGNYTCDKGMVTMPAENDTEYLLYDFEDPANNDQIWCNYDIEYFMGYYPKVGNEYWDGFSINGFDGIAYAAGIGVTGNVMAQYADLLTQANEYVETGGVYIHPQFLNMEDAEGNIVYVAQEYNGIESVASTDKDAVEATRYDLYGRRLSQPAQGVNIVKMSDGTTRKEMVK